MDARRTARWTAIAVAISLALGAPGRALGQGEPQVVPDEPSGPVRGCSPPCREGETCVGRTCLVAPPPPRPPAPASPPPTRPPPPPPAPPPYAAPHPGYAPPGYSGPAPGYYPPPPGYYPPPPGYYPPPPGYYPPSARRPAWKRGFLAMPYLGFHSYLNSAADNLDPGVRFGTFLGGRLSEAVSLNGELTFDITNADVPDGIAFSEVVVDMTFSPLFHLAAGQGQLVVGPKLGFFALSNEVRTLGTAVESSASGYVAGLNVGAFFPIGEAALGALFSFELKEVDEVCTRMNGAPEQCTENVDAQTIQVLGLSFAALF